MKFNLERIIKEAEANLQAAPPGFAAAVMRRLPQMPQEAAVMRRLPQMPQEAAVKKVPVLSKRLCAAVCFSSAAAIMLLMVVNRHISQFVSEQSGLLDEVFVFFQNINITIGGN
jgi:actin-like ATPase involved in cell morphogenesis